MEEFGWSQEDALSLLKAEEQRDSALAFTTPLCSVTYLRKSKLLTLALFSEP